MNLNIDSIHFKADSKLLDYITEKAEKLDKFYDKSIDLNVKLKLESNGQVRDKIVEYVLNVPGDKLFVSTVDKTFEAAADTGIDSLKRQLKRYKDRQRQH
ncbi:MAG: ribosome-associated translation inhibitor RaiA [Saprospiraceae bacterium]|jgi:putative sigma-54 modulation protein|nr:ribosome-associated translation inhibitor RaiA [Saprospiraceae bacterium]